MQLELPQFETSLRIVPSEPVSVEQFWQMGFANRDLRLEREPNGDILVMTPTMGATGFWNSYIISSLFQWAERDGRGYALDSSAGFTLPDSSVRSPDAAWISRERWTPGGKDHYAALLCPDFIIELRSKSDRLGTLQQKMQTWIDNGVELAWLIDPERKIVEVYRRGSARADILEGVTAVYGESPVGGFILELSRIWG
jgi:Uma2 family endonuclease